MNAFADRRLSANVNSAFWICGLVTIASALTSAGFSLAALSSSGGAHTEAHTNAMYAASRSLPLALVCILSVLLRSRASLVAASFLMILVQAGDALIGALNHEPLKTFGPAFTALGNALVLVMLLRTSVKAPAVDPR